MADQKLTQLTAVTTLADDDILYIVVDPSGTAGSRKITYADLVESKIVGTARLYTKGQALETVVLTSTTNTVDYDLADSNAFELTATEDTEIQLPTWNGGAFPANHSQSYEIEIIQDGTGGRTITFATGYKFDGGTVPTLPTTAGDRYLVTCSRKRNGEIYAAITNPN